LVAVSGGPDSVALLYGLFAIQSEFDLHLFVAHLNHKLRGAESDEDERFVKELADRLKLSFFSKKVNVKREAKKRKQNIEECAREIRYRYLQGLSERIKADKIATGHQADDQAETFLMRLLRGAGGGGLSGIPVKRGKIIRSLIQIKREEIEKFLKANKLHYRLDSSNYLTDYFRNKIRWSLLPEIKRKFNPKIVDALNRAADIISCQQDYIEKKCKQILHNIGKIGRRKIILDLKRFVSYDICLQRELIRLCAKALKGDSNQLGFDTVDRVLHLVHQKRSGRKVKLVGQIWMEVSEKELVCYKEEESKEFDCLLTFPGEEDLEEQGIKIKASLVKVKLRPKDLFSKNQNIAFLDWEKLKSPFHLRSLRKGDRFKPLGMKGTKSLADFFIDAKVPRHIRDEVPILTSKGKIAWVVGYRISEEFKVTDKTKKVLRVEATFAEKI